MAQHSNYWSCSKFADWLRGTKKPYALGWNEWDEWRADAQAAHPIRYWLADEGLQYLQDFLTWPVRKFHDVKYYINNRWVTKTHAMTSTLTRGKWYDLDTRLMHCMFDELVNFVEIESAWHHTLWSDEARKKFITPWYTHGFWRCWRTWRCPEAGIEQLTWASGLEDNGQPTAQALAAKETLALYHWWKLDRPARRDIYDVSGWTDICSGTDIFDQNLPADTKAAKERSMEVMATLEKMYEREDEQMMIRLIKVRRSLWT